MPGAVGSRSWLLSVLLTAYSARWRILSDYRPRVRENSRPSGSPLALLPSLRLCRGRCWPSKLSVARRSATSSPDATAPIASYQRSTFHSRHGPSRRENRRGCDWLDVDRSDNDPFRRCQDPVADAAAATTSAFISNTPDGVGLLPAKRDAVRTTNVDLRARCPIRRGCVSLGPWSHARRASHRFRGCHCQSLARRGHPWAVEGRWNVLCDCCTLLDILHAHIRPPPQKCTSVHILHPSRARTHVGRCHCTDMHNICRLAPGTAPHKPAVHPRLSVQSPYAALRANLCTGLGSRAGPLFPLARTRADALARRPVQRHLLGNVREPQARATRPRAHRRENCIRVRCDCRRDGRSAHLALRCAEDATPSAPHERGHGEPQRSAPAFGDFPFAEADPPHGGRVGALCGPHTAHG